MPGKATVSAPHPHRFFQILAVCIVVFAFHHTFTWYSMARAVKRANILGRQHRAKESLAMLKPYFQAYPWNSELAFVYANALMTFKRYDEAAQILENAKRLNPNYFIRLRLAGCYEQLKQWDKALREYNYILDYASFMSAAEEGKYRCILNKTIERLMRITTSIKPKRLKGLERNIDWILKKYPDSNTAWIAKCDILVLKNAYHTLKNLTQNTDASDIASRWINIFRVRKTIKEKKWPLLITFSNKVIDDPESSSLLKMRLFFEIYNSEPPDSKLKSEFHVILGRIFMAGGNPRKAASEFREALKYDPENESAQFWLAKVETPA